jgi:hypothetical protein
MEQDQKEKYLVALAGAIALVIGPRDQDYNQGGFGLRDYWTVNGIRSPLQMVDIKLKRALSQVATWDREQYGPDKPVPTSKAQVEKLVESMMDLINYAAFTICEAESLYESDVESALPKHVRDGMCAVTREELLAQRLAEGIKMWQAGQR